MRMQGEKGTVIGEKNMKNEEYKKMSIKEFTKAEMCIRDRYVPTSVVSRITGE